MEYFGSDMGLTPSGSNARAISCKTRICSVLLLLCGLFCCDPLPAQSNELPDVPQRRHLAAALADDASRTDTLMTLAAVAALLQYGAHSDISRSAELETRFRNDRAWLDRLAARYGQLPIRPSILDPAAWFLSRELYRRELEPDNLTSPLGPDSGSLLRQVFDRSDERLAASLLPELLFRMELESTSLWSRLLEQLAADPGMEALVLALNNDWFEPWFAAEPPAPIAQAEQTDVIIEGIASLSAIAGMAMVAGPPDPLRLKRLRFNLLIALPELNARDARDAEYLLSLANATQWLYRHDYLPFAEALLWVTADMLISGNASIGAPSRIPPLLADLLPGLSETYAGRFSQVDPRINAGLAVVYDAMQYLPAAAEQPWRQASVREQLADVIARLVLLIPDLDYYFEQPVRGRIATETDNCIGMVAERDNVAWGALDRQQVENCLGNLFSLASGQVGRAELAGDPDGPFGAEQLRRELLLTPWQRVNYVLGYLHEKQATGCEMPAQPLPNPFEWSGLVTLIAWVAAQAPVYFRTPENETRVLELRERGTQLLEAWVQQIDCISAAGGGLNDPVARGLADYREHLDRLVGSLREAEIEFRNNHLKPGADVVLHGDADQRTAFRSEELLINPCDTSRTCGVTVSLEATRALIGQFPDPYLIAEQTGLGTIEICYDNVQWVNRRAEPVRADDPYVANYFGHLSFDLLGRYHEAGNTTDVFGFNFVSPTEQRYLFAAASDEVLGDGCPIEWIGSRIVTPLIAKQGIRVVPDRLTYLAAARTLPSELMIANWSRKQEWRDNFVTGLDVSPYRYPKDASIIERVNQHLQSLHHAEQSALYRAMLRPDTPDSGSATDSLSERVRELTVSKALLRSYMTLFYPQLLVDSTEVRGLLVGQASLLDRAVLQRLREANIDLSSINETGVRRLERFQLLWNRQPEAVRRSGTPSIAAAHAITRLDTIYQEFFAAPSRGGQWRQRPATY